MLTYQIKCEGVAPFNVDANIATKDEMLKAMIAVAMPEVGNATITRHEPKDGVVIIEIVKRARTKGVSALDHLVACKGGDNPAQVLRKQLLETDLASLTAEQVLDLTDQVERAVSAGTEDGRQMGRARSRLYASRCGPSPYPVLM